MGFGDSALEFELRLRIVDIRRRYDVTSELNFKINEAFKKAGIVIPFPQRDLHIKDWSPESKKKSK
jgi:small-conductance mechanosensitive channel